MRGEGTRASEAGGVTGLALPGGGVSEEVDGA